MITHHQPAIDFVNTTTLANGAKVLTERMPGLRSATIGIWIRTGSRHEPANLNGICHFIEHAVFKGTGRRSAMDIAVESDRLGGHFDAYTTHEMTAFAMKIVDTQIEKAFDLIADMILAPRFDAEDLEREARVIIEEMKMVEDSPEEHLGEIFNLAYFPHHPLGRPIEGTPETVSSFTREVTQAFHAYAYAPENLVIAAAGNIEHNEIVNLAEKAFASLTSHAANENHRLAASHEILLPPAPAAPIVVEHKNELEQAQFLLASSWTSATHADRYAASLLASILGGGTSSRLWQSIREERGLAYSVGASASAYKDAGVFYIYAGTSPDTLDEVLDLSLHELNRIKRETVDADELRLVKDQSISSILLGLESSSARASSLARQEIIHGAHITPDEIIKRIEAVTPEDITRLAHEHFQIDKLALGALGNLNGFQVTRERLAV